MRNCLRKSICLALVLGLVATMTDSVAQAQLSGLGQVMERAHETADSVAGTKSLDEFRTWAQTYVANPQADVTLPAGWFDKHFDAATAQALKAEYRAATEMFGALGSTVSEQRAKGLTKVVVAMHTKAIDPTATGWQNAALQRMTSKVPLYSLRMMRPEKEVGFSLVSFVCVDGRFAFAGKFGALHDCKDDLATKVLCTSEIGRMEKVLKTNGFISTSGVEHLKQAGVLK